MTLARLTHTLLHDADRFAFPPISGSNLRFVTSYGSDCGGVSMNGGNLTIGANAIFSGNVASNKAGALYINTGSRFALGANASFTSNDGPFGADMYIYGQPSTFSVTGYVRKAPFVNRRMARSPLTAVRTRTATLSTDFSFPSDTHPARPITFTGSLSGRSVNAEQATVAFPDDTSFYSVTSGAVYLSNTANVTFGDRTLFQVRLCVGGGGGGVRNCPLVCMPCPPPFFSLVHFLLFLVHLNTSRTAARTRERPRTWVTSKPTSCGWETTRDSSGAALVEMTADASPVLT